MPHYPADHCAKVALTFTHYLEAIQAEMTFFVQDTTDAIFGAPSVYSANFYAAAVTDLVPVLNPEVVLTGVVFEDIRALPYVGVEYPMTHHAGASGGVVKALPTSSCLSLKRTTANLGRSGRGRLYWPIWDSAMTVGADEVDPAYAAAVVAALGDFQVAVEGNATPANLGVVSFQHGGVAVNPGLFQEILGWSYTDTLLDNQRRRLVGRGR